MVPLSVEANLEPISSGGPMNRDFDCLLDLLFSREEDRYL